MEMKIEGLLFLAKKEKTDENGAPKRDKAGNVLMTAAAVQMSTGQPIKFTARADLLEDLQPKDEFNLYGLLGVYQGRLWVKALDVLPRVDIFAFEEETAE